MSRTVTFDCPDCGYRNHEAIAVVRETECESCHVPVYFDDDWEPTLNPDGCAAGTGLQWMLVALAIAALAAWAILQAFHTR